MSEPKRHHYIPVFYLKQWMASDKRLCEYSMPFDRVKPKRKHPSSTAYIEGLYTVPGLPPEAAQIMERVFMSAVDNTASSAMQLLLSSRKPDQIPDTAKMAWARFLYSLILRTPEHLSWAATKLKEMQVEIVDAERDVYLAKRTEHDPPTFEEFREQFLGNPNNTAPTRYLHRFISSGLAVNHIVNMRWSIASLRNTRFPLLTSDRPITMTNGFARSDGHIAIPISPTDLFLAANNADIEKTIHQIPPDEIVATINTRVVEQARKYVYGQDDRQLRFVSNRWGRMTQSTPLG